MAFWYKEPTVTDLTGKIHISFKEVFGEDIGYGYYWSSRLRDADYNVLQKSFDIEGMTVDKIRKEAEKAFTDLVAIIKPQVGNISQTELIKATYDKTVKTVEDGKKAQAAVNAGRPVNPDFIAEILAVLKNGSKKASDEHHYKGYLQCDGFAGYETAFRSNSNVQLVNCMAHIRRHFEQAFLCFFCCFQKNTDCIVCVQACFFVIS